MSIEKPSGPEEEYFLREEASRKKREAVEKARLMKADEQNKLKELHYMKCPKCGFDLQETQLSGIAVDKCYHCGGLWLDKNEWEQIAQRRGANLFERISQVFKHEPEPK